MPARSGRGEESPEDPHAGLNPEQRRAVRHGEAPLLIVAGAGTGKTRTLVHRVAHAIAGGADPGRILLLTFTRRAAAEMLRRVDALLRRADAGRGEERSRAVWGGTFHAVAARLLRLHGRSLGLDPAFTIHDRGDSEDLLAMLRTELELDSSDRRFPRKGTCMAIYSHCVNAQRKLEEVLAGSFPWCLEHGPALGRLFDAYVERKRLAALLDYDDLLLFWSALLADPREGERVRARFDRIFVDEYQDTNRLQAEILRGLSPSGQGLTVVGDDAQSIYAFRAATVRNILDFPVEFPGTTVVKLEQSYRSTTPILKAANAVIALARERYRKRLWSEREGGEPPWLVTSADEHEQAEFIARSVLERREAGTELRQQAVLFRASHHSIVLEAELGRRDIPFVKYGGLKFVETAHVKDLLAFLRLAENPRDEVSGGRLLRLLPGIGPRTAVTLLGLLKGPAGLAAWGAAAVPAPARKPWPALVRLMKRLARAGDAELAAQVAQARRFYAPLLEERYDDARARLRDLEQLEQIASRFPSRRALLTELALDPPSSTEDLAGPPRLDDDYLVLSTIHSAKGLEWKVVHVIHASDGNIPSDLATGSSDEIEEERRLFYVALTRARDALFVCFPQRYYHAARGPLSDQHTFAQLTRFLPASARRHFRGHNAGAAPAADGDDGTPGGPGGDAVRRRLRSLWE